MNTKSGTEGRSMNSRCGRSFYARDVLDVAPDIIGKTLVINSGDTLPLKFNITEVEAYRGEEDKACHASRGRTPRTEVMYHPGGKVYVYFVYGMYWMLNIVTGTENDPQALLVRGVEGINGPGRITKRLLIDGTFYGEDLTISGRIWIEDNHVKPLFKTGPRIGISYAGEPWISKPWRYYI